MVLTPSFGFEPEVKMRPSGMSVAVEWYRRSMPALGKPRVKRLPLMPAGSYRRGSLAGERAFEAPTSSLTLPYLRARERFDEGRQREERAGRAEGGTRERRAGEDRRKE